MASNSKGNLDKEANHIEAYSNNDSNEEDMYLDFAANFIVKINEINSKIDIASSISATKLEKAAPQLRLEQNTFKEFL